MENANFVCPICSARYVSKFKCDHCGELFCDLCETRKVIRALDYPLRTPIQNLPGSISGTSMNNG